MAGTQRRCYVSHSEVTTPISMRVEGQIPGWVNGSLVRLGPGLFEFGKDVARYPMDGMGLLHAFTLQKGEATFHSRFLSSDALKKNTAAKRLCLGEFGTPASPDPSKSMFSKLKDKVTGGGDMSDNSNHFLLYWQQFNVLLIPSSSSVFVLNPLTLETLEKVPLPESLGVDLITEHMQIDSDGTLYLLGSHVKGRPVYHIVKVPVMADVKSSFAAAEKVFSVNGQFKVTPTSFHSFVMTPNFFAIVECPMEINIMKILTKSTTLEAIEFDSSVSTKFHVYNRSTGKTIKHKMECPSFYMLHVINAYEEEDQLILDLLTFRRFSNKELFFTRESLNSESYRRDKPWMKMDINIPVRFVLPTSEEKLSKSHAGQNMVTLEGEKAQAIVGKTHVDLQSRPLNKPGEDRLQYPAVGSSVCRHSYKYYYAGGCGESEFLQYGIGKFDVQSQECQKWEAASLQFLTEPVFLSRPGAIQEDDGVLLFAILDYQESKDRLVILDSQTMTTLAQCFFPDTSVVLPEADHGAFIPINPENA